MINEIKNVFKTKIIEKKEENNFKIYKFKCIYFDLNFVSQTKFDCLHIFSTKNEINFDENSNFENWDKEIYNIELFGLYHSRYFSSLNLIAHKNKDLMITFNDYLKKLEIDIVNFLFEHCVESEKKFTEIFIFLIDHFNNNIIIYKINLKKQKFKNEMKKIKKDIEKKDYKF